MRRRARRGPAQARDQELDLLKPSGRRLLRRLRLLLAEQQERDPRIRHQSLPSLLLGRLAAVVGLQFGFDRDAPRVGRDVDEDVRHAGRSGLEVVFTAGMRVEDVAIDDVAVPAARARELARDGDEELVAQGVLNAPHACAPRRGTDLRGRRTLAFLSGFGTSRSFPAETFTRRPASARRAARPRRSRSRSRPALRSSGA